MREKKNKKNYMLLIINYGTKHTQTLQQYESSVLRRFYLLSHFTIIIIIIIINNDDNHLHISINHS